MALKTVQLQIYIYEGTSGSYSGTDLRYTLQNSLIGTDTNVVFEIAELVRDYLDLTFNNDYLSKTIWVTTVAILLDENNTPIEIEELQEFLDDILNIYSTNTNAYLVKFNEAKKNKSIEGILDI